MKTPKLLDIVEVQWDDGVNEMIITQINKFDLKGDKLPQESRAYYGVITTDKDADGKKIKNSDRSMSFEGSQIILNHGTYHEMTTKYMKSLLKV